MTVTLTPAVPETVGDDPGGFAVRLRGLTKIFGRRTAVDRLDLDIPAGVVCGFVGPNGAGKTTTIRMLLGLVRPTAGVGTVLGRPLGDPPRYLPEVGALIEGPAFEPGLSGIDNLRVHAHAGGLPLDGVAEALERVGLTGRGQDRYRSYSLGMKQRLGIAAALLPRPRLLILDEPTNGLDPAGIAQTRDLIAGLRDDGMTVLVSSHLLSEIEQVADHLLLVQEGRSVFAGPVADLVRTLSTLSTPPSSPLSRRRSPSRRPWTPASSPPSCPRPSRTSRPRRSRRSSTGVPTRPASSSPT